jgi:DNA-binding PadR family transcriptional regulator
MGLAADNAVRSCKKEVLGLEGTVRLTRAAGECIAHNRYIMRTMSERGNLWELAVLALAREEPMHPYQMLRLLRQRHKDDVLELKRGSLYHAINRLEGEGLIVAGKADREGRRPERRTYRLTGMGERKLVEWLQERIAKVERSPSAFMGTLSFLVQLSPQAALAQMETRAKALDDQIAGLEAGLAQARAFVDRINLIESEYLLAMLKAEVLWVRGLLAELREGRFTWDLDEILKAVRAARRTQGDRKESSL